MFDPLNLNPIPTVASDPGGADFLSVAAASPDYATLCHRADLFIRTYDLVDQIAMLTDLQRYLSAWEPDLMSAALLAWLNADPDWHRFVRTERLESDYR